MKLRNARAFVIAASLVCAACAAPQPTPLTPAELAAGDAFRKADDACVDNAKTLDESKQCRAALRAKWGLQ